MKRDTASLAGMEYDLLVIGGGVYGAFAAWDAVLRGLTVALVEKGDFSCGTSANSLKVIHGGLRYLQDADFTRTKESAREQSCFLSIAPHLVNPQKFIIPTEGLWTRSKFAMTCAFGIYDALMGTGGSPPDKRTDFLKGRIVSRQECRAILKGTDARGFSGGAVWYEGIVHNTERFVISILRSAVSKGLSIANYIEAKRFLIRDRRVIGIEAEDRLNGDRFEIRARCTLNTTGPWARHLIRQLAGWPLEEVPPLLKAIDVIVGRPYFDEYAVGLYARQGGSGGYSRTSSRYYFFVPWRGTTMIGTYYAPYRGTPETATVEEKDIEEFLAGIRSVHPECGITAKDISCIHFGLLPMDVAPQLSGRPTPAKKPWIRDHGLSDRVDGLVSLQGVKYTTARVVAEKAVDLISCKLGGRTVPCSTDKTPIFGGEAALSIPLSIDRHDDTKGNPAKTVMQHLVRNYGSEYRRVLGYAAERPELARTVEGSKEVLSAELVHGIREEMAQTLGDLLFRRTDLGTTGHPGRYCLEDCARIAAEELHWDKTRVSREMEVVERYYPAAAFLHTRKFDLARDSGD